MSDEKIRIEEIVPTIEKIKNTIVTMEKELKEKQLLVDEKDKLLTEREEKLNEAQRQQQQLENKYSSLETDFKKVSDLFSELSEKEGASLDVKQLLSIYVTLLEKVFEGKPHAKILYLLHGGEGEKEMTRQELTAATGFSAAIVLHSIHELNRAELIAYDEEEGKAKLVTKIF